MAAVNQAEGGPMFPEEACFWFAVGCMYEAQRERMFAQGHFLTRKEFMDIGFAVMVPAPSWVAMMKPGIMFAPIVQPQVQPAAVLGIEKVNGKGGLRIVR